MEKKEKEYLDAKINRRLLSIKMLVDYQLKQYAKNKAFNYQLNDSIHFVKENINDIKIAFDKIKQGF